jgi:hypothetical protein
MNATERYKILLNIVAQKGVDSGDLYAELARAESMINAMEQGKMMPPPVPPEPTEPTMNPQGEAPPMSGKYDEL